MEIPEIVISVILAGLSAWGAALQRDVANLKTLVAVNTAKDEETWNHFQKFETKLDKMGEDISDIKQFIATQKYKDGSR